MSEELQIRIFSLSSVEFEAGNLGKVIYWLMRKNGKPYYFRESFSRALSTSLRPSLTRVSDLNIPSASHPA